jgi:ankyrin repeat protein
MELIEACRNDNVNEVKRLLDTGKYNVNHDKMTPEDIVKMSKKWRTGANRYNDASPLINACYYDQVDVVKYLLSRDDILVNECFHYSLSPLHIAVFYTKSLELVRLLLAHPQIFSVNVYNNLRGKSDLDENSKKILELLHQHQKN